MNNNVLRSMMAYQMQHPPRTEDAEESRLPAEYVELNYVETSGQTYLDTGMKASVSDEYIVTYAPLSNNNFPIFGDGASKTDSNITLWVQNYNHANFNFGNGNSTAYVLEVDMPTNGLKGFHEYRQKNSTAEGWIDGVYKGQVTPQNFKNSVKMVLFASWRKNSINTYGNGRMKDFIWKQNDVEVRHFVPAMRLSDLKVGMYDLCESVNANTHTPFYLPSKGTLLSGGIATEKYADVFLEIEVNNQNESKTLNVKFVNDSVARIWWGDGTSSDGSVKTHVYEAPGRYIVKMFGDTFKTGDNFYFTLDNVNLKRVHKLGVTRISSSMFNGNSSLTVADDAMRYGLVTVGNNAFTDCSSMEVHSLPDSVQVIGNYAFKGTRIMLDRLPNDLSRVQESGFYECDGIRCELKLNNLTSIGNYGFSYCTGITGLDTPKLSSIGNNAFYGCTGIAGSVTLPSAQSIGTNAFYGCTGITEINLPSAQSIRDGTFRGCTGIAGSVTLPSARWIGAYAFYGCTGITEINLPVATSIGGNNNGTGAFRHCTSLQTVNAPNATTIWQYAFSNCTSLREVNIPSATVIYNHAFFSCTSLEAIELPAMLERIEGDVFNGCSSLKSLLIRNVNSIGGWLIANSGVQTVEIRSDNLLTLPPGVFRAANIVNCYIEAPNMTTIESQAFLDCSRLLSVYLNAPLIQSVVGGAFARTWSLRHVYVPFSQSVFDMSPYVSSGVTVHYDYVFPVTNPGEFFQ